MKKINGSATKELTNATSDSSVITIRVKNFIKAELEAGRAQNSDNKTPLSSFIIELAIEALRNRNKIDNEIEISNAAIFGKLQQIEKAIQQQDCNKKIDAQSLHIKTLAKAVNEGFNIVAHRLEENTTSINDVVRSSESNNLCYQSITKNMRILANASLGGASGVRKSSTN